MVYIEIYDTCSDDIREHFIVTSWFKHVYGRVCRANYCCLSYYIIDVLVLSHMG